LGFDVTVPFDLTCWYLNARRIAELTGMEVINGNRVATSDQLQRLSDLDAVRRSIVYWIGNSATEPVEKLIIEDALSEGKVFTLNTNFFFKGLSAVGGSRARIASTSNLPGGYAKLDYLKPGLKLTFDFHPEHLTSNSSWVELRGQKRMFLLGVVTEITDTEIKAKPYVIGNLVESRGEFFAARRWANHLELHIEQIDTFAKAKDVKRSSSKKALAVLKDIPEQAVKEAFAEIIGEAVIPKDWGGEKSDLFTSAVEIEGRRTSTAFAFKGPAKFRPMTMAELGKNGDQINRLYEEPADLLILQHCHDITPPVRRMMRAFAQQMGNPRTYCVIDGFDTLRILQAYGKCGLAVAESSETKS
jgi:hypothetical protein